MKKNKIYIKVKLDNGEKIKIKKSNLRDCPKCKNKTVRAKELGEGGGVTCIKDNCDYWFCY